MSYRKKAIVIKVLLTVLVLISFVGALHLTIGNGNMPSIVYDILNDNDQPKNQDKGLIVKSNGTPFVEPTTNKPEYVYKHSVLPHTNKSDITSTPKAQNDDHGRLTSLSYALSGSNIVMHPKTESKNITSNHILDKDGNSMTFSNQAWNDYIIPYLDAINDFISANKLPVNITWTFTYENNDDLYPKYAQLEAYTPSYDDMDIRVSFASLSDKGPIDYHTGTLYEGRVGQR